MPCIAFKTLKKSKVIPKSLLTPNGFRNMIPKRESERSENTEEARGIRDIESFSEDLGSKSQKYKTTGPFKTSETSFPKGIIKNFLSHSLLNKFLKNNFRGLSIQWIELNRGQGVEIHDHSVDTLMIACKGGCKLIGDLETAFSEGDTVIIPSHCKHGMYNDEDQFFLGISLRF